MDVFEAADEAFCGNATESLVGSPIEASLLGSSNLFGLVATAGGAPRLTAPRGAASAEGREVELRFVVSASGLDPCFGEIENLDGDLRYQVGQLDSGKQVTISCSDLSSGFTALRFRCGTKVYDYRTGQEGVGGLLCPGSTLQAS